MSTIALSIGGASQSYRVGSLDISRMVNGRCTASFAVRSNDGTYRPAQDAEVLITEDGTRIFGGLVDGTTETSTLGANMGAYEAISTRVNAVDFNAYAERRYVKDDIAAGTLKAALQFLVTNYLSVYGVTLDGSQVNGPTLDALTYDFKLVTDVLNDLMTLTAKVGEAYVWRIDEFKVLKAFQPSTSAAPFDIVDGDGNSVGDVTVTPDKHHYANRVIVQVPGKTEANRIERFTGDGSTTTYTLEYTPTQLYGYVTGDEATNLYETLTTTDFAGTATWTYDADANTITRSSASPVGAEIAIRFDGVFNGVGDAQDASWTTNPIERLVRIESLPTNETAQSYAEGLLAKFLAASETVTYQTFGSGLRVGQSQTITVAQRNLDTTAVITEIRSKDYGKGGSRLFHTVTVTAGEYSQEGWLEGYKLWAGDTGGNALPAVSTAGEGTPSLTGGPAQPNRSVQFNKDNQFGGDASFIFYTDENSVICGDSCSITAASFESCSINGQDNHITDPS